MIVDYIREGRQEITKQEATAILGRFYYCNEEKHVGELLSRMIKSGILERVKRGTYKLKKYPSGITPGDKYQVSKNQISLF